MSAQIELDFNCEHGQTMLDFIYMVEDLKGKVVHFKAYGPGGGNPCIVFEFIDRESMRKALIEYFCGDEEEADEYIDEYAK